MNLSFFLMSKKLATYSSFHVSSVQHPQRAVQFYFRGKLLDRCTNGFGCFRAISKCFQQLLQKSFCQSHKHQGAPLYFYLLLNLLDFPFLAGLRWPEALSGANRSMRVCWLCDPTLSHEPGSVWRFMLLP